MKSDRLVKVDVLDIVYCANVLIFVCQEWERCRKSQKNC